MSFVWESGQVLCFCRCLHAQIIKCYLDWKQHAGFVFCILFCCNAISLNKIVTTTTVPYMDDTYDEDD